MTHAPDLSALLSDARGILFDFNGTLSDDETELELAYGQGLVSLGLSSLDAGEYEGLLGRSEPDIAAGLIAHRDADPALAEELLDHVCAAYVDIVARRPRVSTATVDFVRRLHASGLRIGIVTGTLRRLIEPVLAERGLTGVVDALVTIEDVSQGKPAPEGFLRGADLLGLHPGDIIVFEDSPAGVDAAHAAGMAAVGIGPAAGCPLSFSSMEEAANAAGTGSR